MTREVVVVGHGGAMGLELMSAPAWLSVFDDDDQMEFHRDLHEALMLTLASDSTEPVDRCVREWRTTALALSDPARRAVLVGAVTEDDVEEVDRPA